MSLIGRKSKIPDSIMNGSKSIKEAFLRGYFSGDGGVFLSLSMQKRYQVRKVILTAGVFVACDRKNIRYELAKLLQSLGFYVEITNKQVRLTRKRDIAKFYEEISFVDKCTITLHSKWWHGFEKNQLLKYVVTSLRNDNELKELTYSCSKEKVVEYVKRKL